MESDCHICGNPMVPHDGKMWCSVYGHHRERPDPGQLNMIGQQFDDVKRVVVLFEVDGKQYGWEVTPPGRVAWDMTGIRNGSTQAKMTVVGEFHRLTREAPPPEIEQEYP